ncbi:unnamed protein product [marine sediment metagenome]|uniref:ABC transporter ATPase n=1 Tax=marine sediment metagenome TaxID=412755 RepID=X1BU11_9ZZZZ
MSLVPISSLPPEAKAWCFGVSALPSDADVDRLREEMEVFLDRWTAHRADLRAGLEWLSDGFLVIAVDESTTGTSGCSIDALTTEIRRLEQTLGVDLLDASPVWYRDSSGCVKRITREEFRQRAADGSITEDTRVFDLTVEHLDAIRSGDWEVEAGNSWHARLL